LTAQVDGAMLNDIKPDITFTVKIKSDSSSGSAGGGDDSMRSTFNTSGTFRESTFRDSSS
jgi:hypothetical protein